MGDTRLKSSRTHEPSEPIRRPSMLDVAGVRAQDAFPRLAPGETLPALLPAQERAWAASLQRALGNRATAEMLGDEQNRPSRRDAPSGGAPLPSALGDELGRTLGADLSRVRVHTDEAAATSAAAVSARAFTLGEDIYFARGLYDPGSRRGQRLIAHEVAHTRQQPSGSPGTSAVSRPGEAVEREADAVADAFFTGAAPPRLTAAPAGMVLRDPLEAIHRDVYAPGEAYWRGVLESTEGLAEAWNARVPVVGFVGASVLQTPLILAADLSLIIITALELYTPPDAESAVFVEATLGTGEVFVPVINLARWGNAYLARVLAKNPKGASRLIRRVKDVARAVSQRVAGLLGAKPAPRREPSISAAVDPFGKTSLGRSTLDPLGKTSASLVLPAQAAGRIADEARYLVEKAALAFKEDRAAQALWGSTVNDYRYWHYVEAYFQVFSTPQFAREAVRTWLGTFGRGGVQLAELTAAGVSSELRSLILFMWDLGRTGVVR